MMDIKNILDFVQSLAPAARTATGNGAGVDTANYNAVAVVFEAGAITDGTHTPSVQESDDNSAWSAVAAADLNGALSALTANSVQKVGYMGRKRYVRPVVSVAGATTGGLSSALVVGGYPRKSPV